MTRECLKSAQLARSCGISVLPPRQDGTKAPDSPSWAKYQSTRANEAQIDTWYAAGRTGIGWVCGKVSGGLEVIDFDDRSAFTEYKKLCADSGLEPLLERVLGGYLEHSPNGAHVAYRCKEIEGNQKLAKSKAGKALIETRGEGGFVIVAPSSGGVNVKGPYLLQSGGPEKIATITKEERKALFDVARILDESITPVEKEHTRTTTGGRPGDDFNARAKWDDILKGWTRVSSRLGVVSWRRPGKEIGISATTNHADSDLLYVFSTSTEFDANRGYSKFSAYAILEHNSDFKAAARQLSLEGYGIEEPVSLGEVDISGLMAQFNKDKPKHEHPSIEELLRVPGLVGDLAAWINETSPKKQPVLALGASIAAVSTIIGRKVQLQSGLRSNLYILSIGDTGCGKDSARKCLKWLFSEIGADGMVGESFASGSSIETALAASPSCCYLIDEFGCLLESIKQSNAPSHLRSIVSMLLRMYTSSETFYKRTTYADREKNKELEQIDQPSLTVLFTAVPSNLFSGLTKQQLSDGFLSRLLVFEADNPDPEYQHIDASLRRVPGSIKAGFNHWLSTPVNKEPEGDLDTSPNPMVVKMTPEARSVFDGLELNMREKRKALRDAGDDQGPYTRVHATAMKLALIRACGIEFDRPEITETDARWGSDLAWLLTDKFLEKFNESVVENKTESNIKRVLAIIKDSKNGITKNRLTHKTRWLLPRERVDLISDLKESCMIIENKTGKLITYVYAN